MRGERVGRQPDGTDLFGLSDRQRTSGLPGIAERLLEPPVPGQAVPQGRAETIAQLMTRLG